jgi:hypothetical protein
MAKENRRGVVGTRRRHDVNREAAGGLSRVVAIT